MLQNEKKAKQMNPEINFIKQKFKEYYQKKKVVPPPDMERREYGFGNDKKIDYRHFAFKKDSELQEYFITQTPLYASCSVAYYEFPAARPMENKHLQGADLVFEFDAECAHEPTCIECLEKVKEETIKLIEEFLIPDFGFKKEEIKTYFSGARGYHIYVRSDTVKQLDSNARRQIVDYIQGRGIDLKKILQGATPQSGGWKGKIAKLIYEFVEKTEPTNFRKVGLIKSYKRAGLSKLVPEQLQERKEYFLNAISSGNYSVIPKKDWEKIIDEKIVHMSANVDELVTLDVCRLMRLPSTLHGGTGLLCAEVKDLCSFKPFSDTVVFGTQPIKIKIVKKIPMFSLKEQTFGPFNENEVKELPEFAALFLICKELARVA